MKDTIRADVPYDEQHPNFDKLSPQQQEKLGELNEKLKSGTPLSESEKPELNEIKDFMDDPLPIDQDHPGWHNLSPMEQDQLQDL